MASAHLRHRSSAARSPRYRVEHHGSKRRFATAYCIADVDLSHWGKPAGACPGRPHYGPQA